MDSSARTLLSPLTVGSVELRNRVVSTAHGAFLDFYRPGEDGERYIAYQERRARGGTGLIVLQPVHVHHTSQAPGHHVYDPADLEPKLREMARRLHAHGSRVLIQLLHFGAAFRSDASTDLEPLWGFSPILSSTGSEPAHAMTADEIEEVIDGYVRTAVLAVESGLDGVELQAGHGYLVHQSLSPWGNRRGDEWGERDRFARTILARIRAAVGRGPVVGLRLSVDDWIAPARGGLGPQGLREVAAGLVGTGDIDYLGTTAGARAAHYARSIGSHHHAPGGMLELVARMRTAIGAAVPVVGVGRVVSPQLAERALREGVCDLVGMTRAQIADPDLVAKLRTRGGAALRPCVGANSGCVDRMVGGLPITCFHNPEVGREHRRDGGRARHPRRVLVVGGGPAGAKAAEAAARRGHAVTLAERGEELGGRLRCVARAGAPRELLGSIEWIAGELRRLGVTVELGVEVDAARLEAFGADAIVLATGARPAPEQLPPGDGSVPVASLDEAVAGRHTGLDVLVVDQLGITDVAMTAECVAETARSVVVVTPMQSVGAHIGFTQVKDQLTRLHGCGCALEASTALTDIAGGEVTLRHVHSGALTRRRFDLVVAGVQGLPDLTLHTAARRAAPRVVVAGDAVAPRSALHAFREGDAAARAVEGPGG